MQRYLLGFAALVTLAAAVTGCSGKGGSPSETSSTQPVASTSPGPTREPGDRPNIIFVLTDDQTAADFAFMPNTKALIAEQGTTFPNFFVTVSLCCPSRSTILRGQYAHNHGVLTNSPPNGGYGQFQKNSLEDSTVATWLQEKGYRTGLFGKYLNGYPEKSDSAHIPKGWDAWYSPAKGGYDEFNYTLNENGKLVAYGRDEKDYLTDVLSTRATGFIRQTAAAGQPFFIYVAPFAPHGPSTPAPRHAKLFADVKAPRTAAFDEADVSDKPEYVRSKATLKAPAVAKLNEAYRKRLQSLQAVDEMVAEIMKTLEETGQRDNTYVFVTSDNGFMQGQHRIPNGKQVPYEESIRVSLLVRGPGVPAGKTVDALTGNVDLAPTFAAVAGVEPPSYVDGRSLLPLLGTGSPPASWRKAYLVEHWLPREDAEGDLITMPEFHGVRTADALYVEYATGERELYDLRRDPNELDNLASKSDAGLLAAFSDLVAKLKRCAAAECRAAETASVPGGMPRNE